MLRRLLIGFGELAVTFGLVVVLLAAYELWWTNASADAGARSAVAGLEQQWQAEARARASASASAGAVGSRGTGGRGAEVKGAAPSAAAKPPPLQVGGAGGSGIDSMSRDLTPFAVLRIPALGIVFPVAEGIDKYAVLNHGYIGHYPGTAMPGQPGNFAVAGHRNTHGEPFRHLERLNVGDVVIVETAGWTYYYRIDSILPETSQSDVDTVAPVPHSSLHPGSGYGYTAPGRYLTLTTCTPAFTSLYRMIAWGRLVTQEARTA
ncbi:class E sortase [Streptacidiphilus carbonis]|uniref:class E sortase n=1 Tax=Streptacidiphilus carbonis TaxID=105422 RepID=UPI00069435CE|nr:class E sortase [Streptacidiphilus carbonis]